MHKVSTNTDSFIGSTIRNRSRIRSTSLILVTVWALVSVSVIPCRVSGLRSLSHTSRRLAFAAPKRNQRPTLKFDSAESSLSPSWSYSTPSKRGINGSSVSKGIVDDKSKSVFEKMKQVPVVSVSDDFDGGNGEYVSTVEEEDGMLTVRVNIRKDPYTELEKTHHSQYFSFRAKVGFITKPKTIKYVVANAGDASYAEAWKGSTTFASCTPEDPFSWRRELTTSFNEETGELSWTHEHEESGSWQFAYFPPYSYERHMDLISKCEDSTRAEVMCLGQTLDGRDMHYVKTGTGDLKCWIIHRQHPGETMAEYYAEGLLNRLLGLDTNGSIDGMACDILKKYTFYIVPNMCLDGSFRGHLRTNAHGQNLNREWAPTGEPSSPDYYDAPTMERSPEVFYVLKQMDETGVDAFLDVHGDEELPFNFLAGAEGCPNWSPRLQALHGAFLASYSRVNSDMQCPVAYDPESAGEGRINICSNQVTIRYDCFAATLEMPFKDCLSNPDPDRGWNPARAMQLGASVIGALDYVHPYLRDETEFWNDLSPEDAYVRPSSNY